MYFRFKFNSFYHPYIVGILLKWHLGGAVVECLTRDQGATVSSLTGVTALVLVQQRKTHPCLIERLLMGRKESNQILNGT